MIDKYNKHIIIFLFITVLCLSFLLSISESINFTWRTLIQSLIVSLLASFLFFIVFRKFDINKENNEDINPHFKKIKLNSEMGGEKYWNELINDLETTNEDVYFYGHRLDLWLRKISCRNTLLDKLNKRKKRGINNKVYFILHNAEYMDKWDSFFKENEIEVDLFCLEGRNCYSIVCCGRKMVIILKTHDGAREDCPTIEISSECGTGKFFLEYLKHIVTDRKII